MTKRSFIIPERVVPEETITRCYECPWFCNRCGSWGEYHQCNHTDSTGQDLWFAAGEEIAHNCPMLKEES